MLYTGIQAALTTGYHYGYMSIYQGESCVLPSLIPGQMIRIYTSSENQPFSALQNKHKSF